MAPAIHRRVIVSPSFPELTASVPLLPAAVARIA
jgi:hypothetical protein